MALRDPNGNYITPYGVGNFNYEYDWFSGSQIGIMFDDVLIDSAVAIGWNREQSKTPVYGYANQYYTFMADGHIIVQGSITVAFKESGYLLWPLQRIQDKASLLKSGTDYYGTNSTKAWSSPRYSVDENGKKINYYDPSKTDYTLTGAADAAKRKRVMEANVEQVFAWQKTANQERQNANFNRYWRELGALNDNEFEDWAEVFEDAIWFGSDKANPLVREKLFSGNLPEREVITDEQVLSHRNADQYPTFDLLITYGDMSHDPTNHTVKKLLDVSFVGQSQQIEISGQPIYETYTFIARTIV